MRFLIENGIFMFYFQKKHPKSHIEKIYYFPIAIIPICKVSTIDLRKSVYCHKKPGILTHIKCLFRNKCLLMNHFLIASMRFSGGELSCFSLFIYSQGTHIVIISHAQNYSNKFGLAT